MVTPDTSRSASAEKRLEEFRILLPSPPEPFGTFVEAVRKGNLLFLTGCFPRKAARRSSLDVSALNSMWKRGAMRLMLRRFNALAVAAAAFEIPR